jgi:hypothetical protein
MHGATIDTFVAIWDMTIVFSLLGVFATTCGLLSLPNAFVKA